MKKTALATAICTAAFLTGLVGTAPADAQSCPAGTTYNPGGPGGAQPCIPISDYSGGSSSGSQGHWATRWGAYATGEQNKVGMASGMPSRGKAKEAAIAHCQSRGDTKCEVNFTYYNQCAIVVTSPKSEGPWINRFQSAATLEEASGVALEACRKDGGLDCKLKFPSCSYQEYVE